ncbi:MAG: glycosyltransferase WbuB, partial [Magnetococcales bacterium]|nr:glycosyltransferase WbuB [Magnetococcales bacterium]
MKPAPRIVFVNRFFHPDHSATSQMLSGLAAHLAGRGHGIHVVTSRLRYGGEGAPLAPREVWSGVTVHRVWTSRFGRDRLVGRALDYLSFYLGATWTLGGLLRPGDRVV